MGLPNEDRRGDEEDFKGQDVEDVDESKYAHGYQADTSQNLAYPVTMLITRKNMQIPFIAIFNNISNTL